MTIKLFKKLKFYKSESRMNNTGDVKNAIKEFEKRKNNNLRFLIKDRFSWMNAHIIGKKNGIELGAGVGFSKYYIKNKKLLISDILNNDHLDLKKIDALDTKFKKNKFDFIIVSNAIHHMRSPLIFFDEAHRILKKNGKIVIFEQNCSLLFQIITFFTKHEGFNFNVDLWDKKKFLFPKNQPWAGNIAIANLLFDDKKIFDLKFKKKFKLEFHQYCECLIFLNSGGVYSKTFYLPLSHFFLNILKIIDAFLCYFFPSIFALSRKVVVKKI